MTEKYIDLADAIKADHGWTRAVVESILTWLDDHPDQAPGRTITESDYSDITEWARNWNHLGYQGREVLAKAGITIVPDPKPTNAEKLKAVLDAIGDSTDGYREHLASKLDDAGVKAPGGDDDQ